MSDSSYCDEDDDSSDSLDIISTKLNESGYLMYLDHGYWKYIHREVAEEKIGRVLSLDEHVHHINKNKTDNRPENLVVLKSNIHKTLHQTRFNERNCCFRCGRNNHWVENCIAKSDVHGNKIE